MARALTSRLRRLEHVCSSTRPCRVCRDGASNQEVVRFIHVPGRNATGANGSNVAEGVPHCAGCRREYGVVYVSGIDPEKL